MPGLTASGMDCGLCAALVAGLTLDYTPTFELATGVYTCGWTAIVPGGAGCTDKLIDRTGNPVSLYWDPTQTLWVLNIGAYPAIYTAATWDCASPLTLNLSSTSDSVRCSGWPATVTVNPTPCYFGSGSGAANLWYCLLAPAGSGSGSGSGGSVFVDTTSTSGNTWTSPLTGTILVELYGAGSTNGDDGGGGGSYCKAYVNVIEGNVYAYVVGSLSTASQFTGDGTDSINCPNAVNGTGGGIPTSGGTITLLLAYTGGNGGAALGGGGGGCAGPDGNGGDGGATAGGAGGLGGGGDAGDGGAGGAGDANGGDGGAVGGGGGGGGGGGIVGAPPGLAMDGAPANGEVKITY